MNLVKLTAEDAALSCKCNHAGSVIPACRESVLRAGQTADSGYPNIGHRQAGMTNANVAFFTCLSNYVHCICGLIGGTEDTCVIY